MLAAAFDKSVAYVAQEDVFFDDGREEELVNFVTSQSDIRGCPKDILDAIDDFGRTRKYLMNVGSHKGSIVASLIQKHKPETMLELGGYCGYSTIMFAAELRSVGGKRYYSLERNTQFARNIESLITFAGLDDIVEVVVGPSGESIKKLHHDEALTKVDMMFLDHYKPAYTTDLKLCESLGLIREGTVLAADNVISPGNPPYLQYVRSTPAEKRAALREERNEDTTAFPERSAAQYGKIEDLSSEAKGNPNLIYTSELIDSFEPTGVPDGLEITMCTGVEDD